ELAARHDVPIVLPDGLDRPDSNHLQIRFIMRLKGEGCGDTQHPSLTATVYKQSRLSYQYEAGFPRTPPSAPDLGAFPQSLLEPSSIQPDRLMIAVPDQPSTADLEAAANVAAAVGRYAGGRDVGIQLAPASGAG